jgi:hypothetical protein
MPKCNNFIFQTPGQYQLPNVWLYTSVHAYFITRKSYIINIEIHFNAINLVRNLTWIIGVTDILRSDLLPSHGDRNSPEVLKS